MPPVRNTRIASSQPSCITYNRYDSKGNKLSIATPSSRGASIPTLTLPELAHYFTTAHDEVYDLLDGDSELHRIVYAIDVLTASSRAMEAIRQKQEQYIRSQFRIALRQGLHGRLAPLIKEQRIIDRPLTPFYHDYPTDDEANHSYATWNTADKEYLATNKVKVDEWRSVVADSKANWDDEGVNEWNRNAAIDWEEKVVDEYEAPSPPTWSEPKDEYKMSTELKDAVATLEERLSSPPLTYVFNDPTLDPPPVIPTCGICHDNDHITPDCLSYVCFHCDRAQAGHYPAACPDLDEYFDATD